MLDWLKKRFGPPQPAGQPRIIQRFDNSQMTISSGSIVAVDDGWHIKTSESMTIRLFELDPGDIENGLVTYRASIKSEQVQGRGYLEMWCQLPGQGEFFSRGFDNPVKGDNNWAGYEIPFYLKKNQKPDLLKLNFTLEGGAKIWIKDIEVIFTPFK